MSKPRYRHAHQQERKRWAPLVARGEAQCAEARCLMTSRWIPPGSTWDLAHDETGTIVIGVSHAKCNRSEGATRGNRMRGRRRGASKPRYQRRTPARPANRWIL